MSQLNVDDIYNNAGTGGVNLPAGVSVSGISTFANVDVELQGSTSGITSVTWDASADSLIFKDNSYAKFGNGSDLSIYHDGSNSYLKGSTGFTLVYGATGVALQPKDGEYSFYGAADGESKVYHDGNVKLETTNTGAVITGIATATTQLEVGSTIQAEAASGIVTATAFIPTAGQLSNRNLIINGAFQVAQYGSSSTTAGYKTVDRWSGSLNDVDEAPTFAQHALTSSDTGPWQVGFRYSYHLTNGNQTGGAGTVDKIEISTALEAQDIANSGWDYTSTSSYITLSFWVRSSVAQNFFGHFKTTDGTAYNYPFETGSLTADTWTKVIKTIPGNSNLQFDNNTDVGLTLLLYGFMGTALTGSVSLNTWAAYNSSTRTPDQTSTWYTTNDSTLEITGVQLEVGSTNTPFEHRSYGQELARCQRYYYRNSGNKIVLFSDYNNSTSNFWAGMYLPVTMRAAPSATVTTIAAGAVTSTSTSIDMLSFNASSGNTHFDNSTVIEASAEL